MGGEAGVGLVTAFGDYIRAARLGFHWSPLLEAFLRISDAPGGRWLAELSPPGRLPSNGSGKKHRRWWDDQDPDELVRLSPALLKRARPPAPVSLLLDDDGAEVR